MAVTDALLNQTVAAAFIPELWADNVMEAVEFAQSEKAARASIPRANAVIGKLKGSKEMGNVGVGLEEVPMPGAGGGNSTIDELIRKYR